MKQVLVWLTIFISPSVLAQDAASLSAPEQATIGSEVEVTWNAPGNNYDSVYVIAPGATEDASGIHSVSILNRRNPIALRMPEHPGTYQLRYWSREHKAVLARAELEVVDVPTRLEAADSTLMGSPLEVHWTGPGNQYDPIGLYPEGAADDAKAVASASIVSGRNPVIINLPELPGRYELRYLTREQGRILARRSIVLKGVETSISAATSAELGATIEVSWIGPGNQYDRIELHLADAAQDTKAIVAAGIVSKKNPVPLRLPEQPGQYELRYVTARSGTVLATTPLTIGAVESILSSPDPATAATPLAVTWTGPGNNYDQIALFEIDAGDHAKPLAVAAILSGRNPVILNLPDVQGAYELRYLTAQSGQILARQNLRIDPAGRLAVVFERMGAAGSGGTGAVELILDASGSMLQRQDGERRIDIAKGVLTEIVEDYLGEDRQFALRVFGHRQADACRTDLEIPLQILDRRAAVTRIASINAMNLAKTPIADSLAQIPIDLASARGPKTVILVTDGEETCEGDPGEVIQSLRSQGLEVQISIVGFAIEQPELIESFENWSRLGGGSYFNASSAEELMHSLRSVISGPFRVRNESGDIVASGVISGADVVLPAGRYQVESVGANPLVVDNVVIEAGETTTVAL